MRNNRTMDEVAGQCVAMRLRALSRAVTRMFDEEMRADGLDLTAAQMNLLSGIGHAGPVAGGDLARAMFMDKSTVSRNLKRLVEQGWVSTHQGQDARTLVLAITPAGRKALRRALPAWRRAQRKATKALGESSVAQLDSMMARLGGHTG